LPSFADLEELRKVVDSVLFTTERGRAIVENTSTYMVLDQIRKKTDKKLMAFCFFRAGRLASRELFDKMIESLYNVDTVLAVSVVIGLFDVICEVAMLDLAELKEAVSRILSIPGISTRALMVGMVLQNQPVSSSVSS